MATETGARLIGYGSELGRLEPSELLVARSLAREMEDAGSLPPGDTPLTVRDDWLFDLELAREESFAVG